MMINLTSNVLTRLRTHKKLIDVFAKNVIGTLKDVGHGSVSVKPDGTVTFTM